MSFENRRTLHGHDEVDRVLVLHLVDVDLDRGPLAAVGRDVLLQPLAEGLDDLERGLVRHHQVRGLPH